MNSLTEPDYWNLRSDYRTMANDFTTPFSSRAWELASVPPDARILDIAAGAGALTRIAAEAGHRVLAVDFSQSMIDAILALKLRQVEARIMDGQALAIADDSFDAAFSMFGVMLFEHWNKGLAEMARVLRPGGVGCIGAWSNADGAGPNLLIASLARRRFHDIDDAGVPGGMIEWSYPDRLMAALDRAGLVDWTLHTHREGFVIDTPMLREPERLFQFSPLWSNLNQKRREALLDEIFDLAARAHGTICVESDATIAIFRKP